MKFLYYMFIFCLCTFANEIYAQEISYSPLQQVVPSNELPDEIKVQSANNNLDLVKYHDQLFFAFRTGPTHFASPKVNLYILRKDVSDKWRLEKIIRKGRDIREPRFLVYKD